MQQHLSSNKGEINYDKLVELLAKICPDKESLFNLFKNYANKDALIDVLTYYIEELYRVYDEKEKQRLLHSETGKSSDPKPQTTTDYSKTKSRLYQTKPKKQVLDPKSIARR